RAGTGRDGGSRALLPLLLGAGRQHPLRRRRAGARVVLRVRAGRVRGACVVPAARRLAGVLVGVLLGVGIARVGVLLGIGVSVSVRIVGVQHRDLLVIRPRGLLGGSGSWTA